MFSVWLGIWLYFGGAAQKSEMWVGQAFSRTAADKGLVVQNVLVRGRVHTDPKELRRLIGVERGDPIMAFDPGEIRDLLERIPWVKEARVERRLPDTIYIGLVERAPLVLWQNKGKVRLIDSDGVTLTDKNLKSYSDLLLVVGEEAPRHAPELVKMLVAEPALKERIESATWVSERRWNLNLKGGTVVKMPEKDTELALRRLGAAQEQDRLLDQNLAVIDLRETGRMSIRTLPGAVSEYKAGNSKERGI